jgi:polar amino acid transport system substrate-binding protein
MRHLFRAATLIILAAACAACSRQAPPPDSPAAGEAPTATESAAVAPRGADCRLTMGWDPWPPFHYEDVGGELAGFDVALLHAMTTEAGCELRFERDSWGALLGKLREGRLDLLTGATSTEDRREFALFSAPIRREEFALYVRAGEASAWRADAPGELMEQGFRLGVIDAYVYDDLIERILTAPVYTEQVVYAHFGEALGGMLLDDEIDGFVENVYAAASIIRRLGLSESITRHPLRLGEGTDVHIMYSKASVSAEQVAQLDAALQRLKDSGRYEALRVQYLE